jgi:hypothetical protein
MSSSRAVCLCLLFAACAAPDDLDPPDHVDGPAGSDALKADGTAVPATFHGGAVLSLGINVYVIWYGPWATGPGHTRPAMEEFLRHLDDPAAMYWNILSSYTDQKGNAVVPKVRYAGFITDAASHGTKYGDYHAIVKDHLEAGDLPDDPKGVYLVLPDEGIEDTGLCGHLCGSHGYYQAADGHRVHVAHLVHPNRCPKACGRNMPKLIAHELAETVTDPEYRGWYDAKGSEMADKCAAQPLGTVTLGTHDYTLPQLWLVTDASAGECAMGWEFIDCDKDPVSCGEQ